MADKNKLEYRGAHWVGPHAIDCEINMRGEWWPFTARPNDPEEYGRNLFAALAEQLGPYVETTNEGPE